MKILFYILFFVFVGYACKKTLIVDDAYEYDPSPYNIEFSNTLVPGYFPSDNEITKSKVQLGRMLFYESALSLNNEISCATCHGQTEAFSDSKKLSIGVEGVLGNRQSMPLFNLFLHNNSFFWDGRAPSLRQQVLVPIEDHNEMRESLPNVVYKLKAKDYAKFFNRAFGSTDISSNKIALSLEAFLLTLVSDNSKYDRYLLGIEQLSESEERGRVLFFGEYNEFFPENSGGDCFHCHGGNNFEVNNYRNNGLDFESGFIDKGRENVTGNPNDRAKFKIPSLRNVEVTAPYMHDGRFETLEEVIEHYNSGVKNSSTVDPTILFTATTGLMLDAQEKADIINFLKTLTDSNFLGNEAFSNPFE